MSGRGKRHWRRAKWVVAVAVALAGTAGFVAEHVDSAVAQETPASPAQTVARVEQLLAGIRVVDHIDDVDGYDRSCAKGHSCTFGPAWNDPSSRSACDVRNRLLAAQLHDVTFKPGTRDCKVTSGWVADPYSGNIVQLNEIQIDHIVSLKRAYDSGGYQWPLTLRQQFANDTRNLLAVSGKVNASKGSGALEDWMPALPASRCPHVLRYLTVVDAYHLPITTADRSAAERNCRANESLPG